MPNNLFQNKPSAVVAKTTVSFIAAGITENNTHIIYLVGSPLRSYAPNRLINGISGFEEGKGYYIVSKINWDLTTCVSGPLDFFNYKSGNSIIVCDGNSLTAGGYGGLSYPQLLSAKIPLNTNGTVVVNKGIVGQQTSQMIADATTDIDTLYNANKHCILIAWEVGNDIFNNGNVAMSQSRFAQYCNDRRAVGWKVVAITCTPRENAPTAFGDTKEQFEIKLQQANTWMLANWATFCDAIVNARADTRLQQVSTAYWNIDRVHLKEEGNEILVLGIINALKSLYF